MTNPLQERSDLEYSDESRFYLHYYVDRIRVWWHRAFDIIILAYTWSDYMCVPLDAHLGHLLFALSEL